MRKRISNFRVEWTTVETQRTANKWIFIYFEHFEIKIRNGERGWKQSNWSAGSKGKVKLFSRFVLLKTNIFRKKLFSALTINIIWIYLAIFSHLTMCQKTSTCRWLNMCSKITCCLNLFNFLLIVILSWLTLRFIVVHCCTCICVYKLCL